MIDVHIGFMDEEVNELLRCLITQFGDKRPVLAIERGNVTEEDWLFETTFDNYVADRKEISISTVKSTVSRSPIERQPESSAPIETRLAHFLHQELFQDKAFIDERIKSRVLQAEKVKLDNVQFSIIRFKPQSKAIADPIILIRNPEMGMQPSLVRPYERAIMKAISLLDEAHQPSIDKKIDRGIRLHSFASGGAISPKIKPGQITIPWGSLYLGSDVDDEGRVYSVVNLVAFRKIDSKKVTGVIPIHVEFVKQESSILYSSSEEPLELDVSLMKKANKEATELAESYVLNSKDPLLKAALKGLQEHYKSGILGGDFKSLSSEYKSSDTPEITASFSYFDSLETKKKINKNFEGSVVNSNMEDYHVLRLAKSMVERGTISYLEERGKDHKYASLADFEILRVNANVYIPPDSQVSSQLKGHLSKTRLSKGAYVDSIMWGLRGCPLIEVGNLDPAVRQWEFYQGFKDGKETAEDELSYFYTYNGFCMNPFCCEIATDFLKELATEGNPYDKELRDAAQRVRKEARSLTWGGNWDPVKDLVIELVDKMTKPECGFAVKDSDRLYCWLRPGKWKNVGADTICLTSEIVENFIAHEANVDRLFYKSANLLALRSLAHIAAERTAI
jgi:hypothetical protein